MQELQDKLEAAMRRAVERVGEGVDKDEHWWAALSAAAGVLQVQAEARLNGLTDSIYEREDDG